MRATSSISSSSQPAEIAIDAIPNKTFTGRVIEIGNTAILRSTGLAASQSTTSSQEAKDFKVVVAMDNPPDETRPGLSCTAKITTATRKNVLAIPIQALTVRTKGDLDTSKNKPLNPDAATVKANKEEVTGVFVVSNGQQSPVPQGGDRHQRRHRYRGSLRAGRGRPDRHGPVSGDPHDQERRDREDR